MQTGQQRGPKPLTARDWLFGSRPRRLALQFVLENDPGEEGWTKTQLANSCAVDRHGGIRAHLDGLVVLGLLREVNGRYWPVKRSKMRTNIGKLLVELERVPEKRIKEALSELR